MFSFTNDEIINSRIKDEKEKNVKPQKTMLGSFGSGSNSSTHSVLDYTIQIPTITGNSKFVLGKIDDTALQEITKGNLNAIPIHLAYNTGNPYIDKENLRKYDDISRQEVEWRSLNPGVRDSVSKFLEAMTKNTYTGDPLSDAEQGLQGNMAIIERKKLQEMASAIKDMDEKLYKQVVKHGSNLSALIKDSRLELGRRAGVPLISEMSEEEKLIESAKSQYMTKILSPEPVEVDGKKLYKVNIREMENSIKDLRKKNEEYYWNLREADAGWWDKIWGPTTKYFREIKQLSLSEEQNKDNGTIEKALWGVNAHASATFEFITATMMDLGFGTFDQSNSRPLSGILTQMELALGEAKSKDDGSGYALMDFDDDRKTALDSLNEGTKMFTRNLLNTIQEYGLSIAGARTISGAGTNIALTSPHPVGKAVGFGLNVLGNFIMWTNALDFVDDALGLEKDGKKLTAMLGLETSTDNIALARTLFQPMKDDELEAYKAARPELASRLDKYNQFAKLIGEDSMWEFPDMMGAAGNITGDVLTLFQARNKLPAYSSRLFGVKKYDLARQQILSGNWGWSSRLKNNPITATLIGSDRLKRSVKIAEKIDDVFNFKPNQQAAKNWFKNLLQTTDDGIKTWAVAEFLRMHPDATMNDITFAAINGALFNASSFGFAAFFDKMAAKTAAKNGTLNKLLQIDEKWASRMGGTKEMQSALEAQRAWQLRTISDLTLVNIMQGAGSALVEGTLSNYQSMIDLYGGMDRVAQYFTTKEVMTDLISGVPLGYAHYRGQKKHVLELEKHAQNLIHKAEIAEAVYEKFKTEEDAVNQARILNAEKEAVKAQEAAETPDPNKTTSEVQNVNSEPENTVKNEIIVTGLPEITTTPEMLGDSMQQLQTGFKIKTADGEKNIMVLSSPIMDPESGSRFDEADIVDAMDGQPIDLTPDEMIALEKAYNDYQAKQGWIKPPAIDNKVEVADIGEPEGFRPEDVPEPIIDELPDDVIQNEEIVPETVDSLDNVDLAEQNDVTPQTEDNFDNVPMEIPEGTDILVEKDGVQRVEDPLRASKAEELNWQVDTAIYDKAIALKNMGYDIEPYELDAMLKSNTEEDVIFAITQVMERLVTKYGIKDASVLNFINELPNGARGAFDLNETTVADLDTIKKVLKATVTIALMDKSGDLRNLQDLSSTLDHEVWHAFETILVRDNPELKSMYEEATQQLLENEIGKEIFENYYNHYLQEGKQKLLAQGLDENEATKLAMKYANQLATDEVHAEAFAYLMSVKDAEDESFFGTDTFIASMYKGLIDKITDMFKGPDDYNTKALYSYLDTIKIYEHANSKWGEKTSFVLPMDSQKGDKIFGSTRRYQLDDPNKKKRAELTLEMAGLKNAAIEPKVIRRFEAPDTDSLANSLMAYFPNTFKDTSDIIHKRGTTWTDIESIKRELASKINKEDLEEMAIQIFNKFDPSKFREFEGIDLSIANIFFDMQFDGISYTGDGAIEITQVSGKEGQVGQSNHMGKDNNRQNITRYEPKLVGWIQTSNNIQKTIGQMANNIISGMGETLRSFTASVFANDNIHSVKSTNIIEPIRTIDGEFNTPFAVDNKFKVRTLQGKTIPDNAKFYTTFQKDKNSGWVDTGILRRTDNPLIATHMMKQDWKLDVQDFSSIAHRMLLPLFTKGYVPTLASDKSIDLINIKRLLRKLEEAGIAKFDKGELINIDVMKFADYVKGIEDSLILGILGSEYMAKLGLNKEDYILPYESTMKSILPLLGIVHGETPRVEFLPYRDPSKNYEAEDKFYTDNKIAIDAAIGKMNKIVSQIHETGVMYGSMELSEYMNDYFVENGLKDKVRIDNPLFLSNIEIASDGTDGKPFAVKDSMLQKYGIDDENAIRWFNKAILDVLNNLSSKKVIGIIDSLQQLALDPSGSMFFYYIQKGEDDFKFNKYLNKYATYLKFDGSAPSFKTMNEILAVKGLTRNGQFTPEVAKFLYKQVVDNEEQIFTDAYVFDPDSWLALASKLDTMVNVMSGKDTNTLINADGNMAEIYTMYSQAIKDMVEFIMGEKALDAGTITLNDDVDNPNNIHHLLALFGGATPNGSLKTRAMLGNENGHFPLKHAMHPEYMSQADKVSPALGSKLMNALFQFLKDSGVGIVVVPSALKGDGSYKYSDKEIDGVVYKVGAKGERTFRVEGQGPTKKRVKLGQLSKTVTAADPMTGEIKEMQQPIPLTPQLAKETPFTVFTPEDFGLTTPEALGAFLNAADRLSLAEGLSFNSGAKNSLKSQTMPIQLTGNTGLAWDSQKGDPHSLASSAPFRMASFSAASKYMQNVPPEIKGLMEELGLVAGAEANGHAILEEVAKNHAVKIGQYLNGFNKIAGFLNGVVGGNGVSIQSNDQDILFLLKDLASYIQSKESADVQAWKNFKENSLEDRDDPNVKRTSNLTVEKELIQSIAKRITIKDGVASLTPDATGEFDLAKKLTALIALSDNIFLSNQFDEKSMFWRFLRTKGDTAFRLRGKGSISVLDSDRHAYEDIIRGAEYALAKGYSVDFESLVNTHVDPQSGTYLDGSQGISISKDILELHNWKIGDKVFVVLTPPDSIQSFSPMVITGLLAEGKRNTLAFNKKLALELMGRDMDIDTLSIMGTSKEWIKRTEKGEVDMFDLLHQIFTHNKIHEGSAKSALVADKEKLKQSVKLEQIKLKGHVGPTNYLMMDDSIFDNTNSPMRNTLRKDMRPVMNPLNVDDVVLSRRKFSAKPIGEFASLGNNIGQLLGKFKEGITFRSKDIGNGRGLTFKLKLDEKRHDYWFPFQKEDAVDIFQKHPYILDTNEWIAQFAVQGIEYDGIKADDLPSLRAALNNDKAFGLAQAQIMRVIGNMISNELSMGDPVNAVHKVGPESVKKGKFDKFSSDARTKYNYQDNMKDGQPSGKDYKFLEKYGYEISNYDPFKASGTRDYRSIDDVILESMFTKDGEFQGTSNMLDTDFKAMKDELEWLASREVINLKNELAGSLGLTKYSDPMTGLTFDVDALDKAISDVFGMAYSVLQVSMNANNAFIQYPDLLNTFYSFTQDSPERVFDKSGADPFSNDPYAYKGSLVGLFTNKSTNVIPHAYQIINGKGMSINGLIRPAALAVVKAMMKTSIGDSTKLANKGKLFTTDENMRYTFTEDKPLFIGMPATVIDDPNRKVGGDAPDTQKKATRGRIFPSSDNRTFNSADKSLWFGLGFNLFMGLPEGSKDEFSRVPMITIFDKNGKVRGEETKIPLSELFFGDASTNGLHPKIFESLSNAVEKMISSTIPMDSSKTMDIAMKNKARVYYMQYATAALMDGLLAGGYGEGKASFTEKGKFQGRNIEFNSKELRDRGGDGPLGLRLFTVSDKQHFIESLMVHTAIELAADLPLHSEVLTSSYYNNKRLLDANKDISVKDAFGNQPVYTTKDMQIAQGVHKMYAELIMGQMLTSIPSIKGVLGVMQFYDRKFTTNNDNLFKAAQGEMIAQGIPAADINKVKLALMHGMYSNVGDSILHSYIEDYLSNKKVETGQQAVSAADVIGMANTIIRDIMAHPESYAYMKKQHEESINGQNPLQLMGAGLAEAKKINSRKLVNKLYQDVRDVTDNIKVRYIYNEESRVGVDSHLRNLGVNKIFGLTQIGKATYGHLRSLGYTPKIALNTDKTRIEFAGKDIPVPNNIDYLTFMRQAANKAGHETISDKTILNEYGEVVTSPIQLTRYQLFDKSPLTANFKRGSKNYLKSSINKGFNIILKAGKHLHKDTGSFTDFKQDFDNFLKGSKFSGGTPMTFDTIFGDVKSVQKFENRREISIAVKKFAINKMADVLGVPPAEKSQLFTLWDNMDADDKLSPEAYLNYLNYNILKQLSSRYAATLESFDFNEIHNLKPYMNKFLTDTYSLYKIAKNAKKAQDRHLKNLSIKAGYSEDIVKKLLTEANIFEMNTPLAIAQRFSTQLEIKNSNEPIIQWSKVTVNQDGTLSTEGEPVRITISTVNKGSILPEIPGKETYTRLDENGNLVTESFPGTPQLISPAEQVLTIQNEINNILRNQRGLAETLLESIESLTAKDKLTPNLDADIQKAQDFIALNAPDLFLDMKITYDLYDGKAHAAIEFNGVKGSITGNGNFDAVFEQIRLHAQKHNYNNFQARRKELGKDSTFDIALKKFLMLKLYNAQNAAIAMEHKQTLIGVLNSIADEGQKNALARNLEGYIQDLDMLINSANDLQYIPRQSISTAQELYNLSTIMNPLFQELKVATSYSELSPIGKELLHAYAAALGFKKVNDSNFERAIEAVYSHYEELLGRIDEEKQSVDNNALDAMLKFGTLLNNNLSSRLSRQLIYQQGAKQGLDLVGVSNADALYKYNNMIYDRFEKAMGEIMPIYYDQTRAYTKSRIGIDENPFVVDEVLYSLSHMNKNRLIYADELNILEGKLDSKVEVGTAMQVEWSDGEKVHLDEGIFLGNNGKYNVLYSNGKMKFVRNGNILSGRQGKTSTQLDAEILATMGTIFRKGIGQEFLNAATENEDLKNSIFYLQDLDPTTKFRAFKQLALERKRQNEKLRNMMASSGATFKLKEILASAPNYEIHLGYLGGAKVAQAAVGVGGGLISALMGSPNAVGLFGWGLKGAAGFGGNVATRILQNVTSNARTIFELGGFEAASKAIGNIFNERENATVRKLIQKTETFTASELENERVVNKMASKDIKNTIEALELAKKSLVEIANEKNISLDELEQKILSGQISRGDVFALVSTAKQNLRNKMLSEKNKDGINLDILEAIESLKYNPATKEFMTVYGYDIAALMQMRRNVWENVVEGLSHVTKYIPMSEEVTRQMSYKAILDFLVSRNYNEVYTDEEIGSIAQNILNISGGQYGKATRTRFGNTPLGRSMTMYGRFNKNNSVYYLNHVWDQIDNQLLIDEAASERPDLYEINPDGVEMVGAYKNDRGKMVSSVHKDFNYLQAVKRKIALGMAVQATSLATRIGLKIIGMSLFGGMFLEILDEILGGEDTGTLPSKIEDNIALSGIMGDAMSVAMAMASMSIFREGDVLKSGTLKSKDFEKYWLEQLKAPQNFAFGTGIGSGYASAIGAIGGMGLNVFGWITRDQFSDMKAYEDNTHKAAMSGMMDMLFSKAPVFSPLYTIGMTGVQGIQVYNMGDKAPKGRRDAIKNLVFEK